MRTFFLTLICLLASSQVWAAPQVGEAAPDFTLTGSDGNTYTLSQFKGKQHVVIAFFPKAFTGG